MSNIKLKDHNWAAEGIYDTNQSKSQQTINSDVNTKIGQATLQTSSQNLSGATNELKGRADTLDSKYDNVVTVANTQPSSQYNKVWLPLTVSEGTQVPTWAEHQALESSLNGAISKNNISDTIFHDPTNVSGNLNDVVFGVNGYNPNTSNIPIPGYGIVLTTQTNEWKYQFAEDTNGNLFGRRRINNAAWTSWDRVIFENAAIRTYGSSQWTFPSGISADNDSQTHATRFGRIVVISTILKVTAETSAYAMLAQLPSEIAAAKETEFNYLVYETKTVQAGYITNDGRIMTRHPAPVTNYLVINASYVCKSLF